MYMLIIIIIIVIIIAIVSFYNSVKMIDTLHFQMHIKATQTQRRCRDGVHVEQPRIALKH